MTHVTKPGTAARKAGIARRLAGFGAAGFAAALVAAPMAHAAPAPADASSDSGTPPDAATPTDTPTDTGTSPSTPAPTSSAPSSPVSSPAPTTPAPTSSAPSTPAASSAAPTPSAAAAPRAKKAQAAPQADPAPVYGEQKVFVGIQKDGGDYYQPAVDLSGATVTYSETDIDGNAVSSGTCTTAANGDCHFADLAPGDSLTVTQTSAPIGPYVLVNPVPVVVGPCTEPVAPIAAAAATADPAVATCNNPPFNFVGAFVTDPAAPPVAMAETATIRYDSSVDLDPLANDSARGAPATVTVTRPAHGSAVVAGNRIKYTPTNGFGGVDTFSYTITTQNGSSTATVRITVKAPPIATNNTATTVGGSGAAGRAVTIPVLANDSANGGGTITLVAVGNPAHGTAVIRGADVVYTPDAGFVGSDLFRYTIRTANGTATATIRVTVTAPVTVAAVAAAATEPLASTGAPSEQLLGVGSLLLLVGGGATVAGRRRRLDA